MKDYITETRHPFASLIFLVPLLAAYEYGVIYMGGNHPDAIRNGADAWLRWGLDRYGLGQLYIAPLMVVALFALKSLARWSEKPKDPVATAFGMVLESILYAVLLWAISRNFKPILDQAGIVMNLNSVQFEVPAAAKVITFVGAGIYEEVIFRLGLFSVVYLFFRVALLPKLMATVAAAVVASLLFAAAHHAGPYGEWPINPTVFLFRALAGLYFTTLYATRGFAIAVGAHAGYDVLVGVAVG